MRSLRRARRRYATTERVFWLAAAITMVMVPLLLALASTALNAQMRSDAALRAQINTSFETRSQVQRVFSLMQDGETGQRGFLLTGHESFLTPYEIAVRDVPAQLDELEELFAADDAQRRRLERLRKQKAAKFDLMARAITVRREQGAAAAAALTASGRGKAAMDDIRATVAEMTDAEAVILSRQLAQGVDRSRALRRMASVTLATLGLAVAGAAMMAWRYIRTRADLIDRVAAESDRRQAIFDNTMDAVMTLNPSGGLGTFNKAAERMFGYSADEIVGRDVSVLIDMAPGYEGIFLRRLEAARRRVGEIAEIHELLARRKDGSRFPIDVVLGRMEQPDGVHTIAIARDATERRRNEREKAEFVSTVSHELRTPLTSIAGSLGLLSGGAAGELPERAGRLISIAESNSKRLVRLINDLLDMEKIQSGKMTFELAPVDLGEVAAKAVDSMGGFGGTLSVRFEVDRPDTPIMVRADADRMIQVIVNLLSNAAKFSPSDRAVELTIKTIGHRARLTVRDHGPGVPEKFRDRIFSKFAQADASDTREKGGTGLGLAISKEIVERHGGRIWFDSVEGEGATFFVELPVTTDQPLAAAGETAGRLLLVEDDDDVADVLTHILAADGFAIDHARTVAEADKALETPDRYRALLLDLRLPDGNGFDLLRRMRGRGKAPDLPVIVVSASAATAAAGFDLVDWLEKPVDPERLRDALARASSAVADEHRPIVLHVDDDSDVRGLVAQALGDRCEVISADSLKAARRLLERTTPDVVILDVALGDGSGLDLLPQLNADPERHAPVVIFSAQNVDDADLVAAVDAVLTKSRTSLDDLAQMVRRLAIPETRT